MTAPMLAPNGTRFGGWPLNSADNSFGPVGDFDGGRTRQNSRLEPMGRRHLEIHPIFVHCADDGAQRNPVRRVASQHSRQQSRHRRLMESYPDPPIPSASCPAGPAFAVEPNPRHADARPSIEPTVLGRAATIWIGRYQAGSLDPHVNCAPSREGDSTMMSYRFAVCVVATAVALAVGGCGHQKSGSPASTTPAATGRANGGNGPLSTEGRPSVAPEKGGQDVNGNGGDDQSTIAVNGPQLGYNFSGSDFGDWVTADSGKSVRAFPHSSTATMNGYSTWTLPTGPPTVTVTDIQVHPGTSGFSLTSQTCVGANPSDGSHQCEVNLSFDPKTISNAGDVAKASLVVSLEETCHTAVDAVCRRQRPVHSPRRVGREVEADRGTARLPDVFGARQSGPRQLP